jgi:hypothetical protein
LENGRTIYEVVIRIAMLIEQEQSSADEVGTKYWTDACNVSGWVRNRFQSLSVGLEFLIISKAAVSVSDIDTVFPTVAVSAFGHLRGIPSEFIALNARTKTAIGTRIAIRVAFLFSLSTRIIEVWYRDAFGINLLWSQIKIGVTHFTCCSWTLFTTCITSKTHFLVRIEAWRTYRSTLSYIPTITVNAGNTSIVSQIVTGFTWTLTRVTKSIAYYIVRKKAECRVYTSCMIEEIESSGTLLTNYIPTSLSTLATAQRTYFTSLCNPVYVATLRTIHITCLSSGVVEKPFDAAGTYSSRSARLTVVYASYTCVRERISGVRTCSYAQTFIVKITGTSHRNSACRS